MIPFFPFCFLLFGYASHHYQVQSSVFHSHPFLMSALSALSLPSVPFFVLIRIEYIGSGYCRRVAKVIAPQDLPAINQVIMKSVHPAYDLSFREGV
jgi:hypothetical protein